MATEAQGAPQPAQAEATREGTKWVEPADIARVTVVVALEALGAVHPEIQGLTRALEIAVLTNKAESMISPRVERAAGSKLRRAGAVIQQVGHGINVWIHEKLDEWEKTKRTFPVGTAMNRGEMADQAAEQVRLEQVAAAQAAELREMDTRLRTTEGNNRLMLEQFHFLAQFAAEQSQKGIKFADQAALVSAAKEAWDAKNNSAPADKAPQPANTGKK